MKSLVCLTAFHPFGDARWQNAHASGLPIQAHLNAGLCTPNVDMNFGNVAVSAINPGTVILAPAGTRTTGGGGGVTLPATTGTVTAADFTVTGNGNYTYAITLPSSATLTRVGFTETMTANTFTSTPSGTGTLSGGTQNLKVGATLNVAAAQVAGLYTCSSFNVTVNYN